MELVPKNVPSVHMFHKVHFFIALSEICPQQPQTFFISWRRKSFLLLRLSAALFLIVRSFSDLREAHVFFPLLAPAAVSAFAWLLFADFGRL